MGKKSTYLSDADVIIFDNVIGWLKWNDTCVHLCSVVEFKDEQFVKKAIETMNKHDLSGRPLNIKEVENL